MKLRSTSKCLIVRGNKILMVKHRINGKEYYTLPGGRIEDGETPEQAAMRELQEECGVSGEIIRKLSEFNLSFSENMFVHTFHTFHIDIGSQEPVLGNDPELDEESQILAEIRWMTLDEMAERDRAFLWGMGLAGVEQFFNELKSWGDDISYPGKRNNG